MSDDNHNGTGLKVLDLALDAAARTIRLMMGVPAVLRSIGEQGIRSASGVPFNCSEGLGREGRARRNHLIAAVTRVEPQIDETSAPLARREGAGLAASIQARATQPAVSRAIEMRCNLRDRRGSLSGAHAEHHSGMRT